MSHCKLLSGELVDDHDSLIVWCLNLKFVVQRWNVRDVEVLIVTAPRATNPNLQAQAGLFTLHSGQNKVVDEVQEPLDLVVQRAYDDSCNKLKEEFVNPLMRRVVLHHSESPKVMRLLHYEGH